LQQHALVLHALRIQLGEHVVQRVTRHLVTRLERVITVHQDFGLDDGDNAFLLAQRCVTRERMRVPVEAVPRRDAGADIHHGAPLVVNSISRYARRRSSVDSHPIESKRFLIVPLLSSAARMPLPGATSARAISFNAASIGLPFLPAGTGTFSTLPPADAYWVR